MAGRAASSGRSPIAVWPVEPASHDRNADAHAARNHARSHANASERAIIATEHKKPPLAVGMLRKRWFFIAYHQSNDPNAFQVRYIITPANAISSRIMVHTRTYLIQLPPRSLAPCSAVEKSACLALAIADCRPDLALWPHGGKALLP